jgi:hypothetical protein
VQQHGWTWDTDVCYGPDHANRSAPALRKQPGADRNPRRSRCTPTYMLKSALIVLLLLVTGASAHDSHAAWCRVTASYNQRYRDYDVYVHSNQPYRDAHVSDSHGDSWAHETNSEGYADVYLYVSGDPNGQKVTVEVGRARCYTHLS